KAPVFGSKIPPFLTATITHMVITVCELSFCVMCFILKRSGRDVVDTLLGRSQSDDLRMCVCVSVSVCERERERERKRERGRGRERERERKRERGREREREGERKRERK